MERTSWTSGRVHTFRLENGRGRWPRQETNHLSGGHWLLCRGENACRKDKVWQILESGRQQAHELNPGLGENFHRLRNRHLRVAPCDDVDCELAHGWELGLRPHFIGHAKPFK